MTGITLMKKKNNILILVIAFTISGIGVVLGASIPKQTVQDKKESLEECSKSTDKDGKMILESLSHQFFSSF